ncbi:MAG: OsmC family protein [Planctomycetaceae bacterium]|nr:OsmC family protein [Planctomycetaceae bacterium]
MAEITKVEIVDHNEGYTQEIVARQHTLWADEPLELEGLDAGPTPMELLLAALGSCTTITMRMYARRKGWPLETLQVRLQHRKLLDGEAEDYTDRIEKQIEMTGPLSDEQRKRLLEIAERCPVHRTLTGKLQLESREIEME